MTKRGGQRVGRVEEGEEAEELSKGGGPPPPIDDGGCKSSNPLFFILLAFISYFCFSVKPMKCYDVYAI
ncbi:hypothetical protein QJS04_geneDACA016869 [Acorus gramineus]|uniref:Transmembrane protein n=1 Tax=Acorus gramineus TaxID=55184 RepID=A0AAV9ASU0_ACOGR|nr:hypothetical protein QJS04_geneDACA016869 [Acorus gramineus]